MTLDHRSQVTGNICNVIKVLHSCHPKRSEGSISKKILHYVQNDKVGFFGLRPQNDR